MNWRSLLLLTLVSFLLVAAGPGKKGKGGQGGGAGVEPAVLPEQLFNLLLTRPGDTSMTASVLAWKTMDAVITYGERAEAMTRRTAGTKLVAGEPAMMVMDQLKPGTLYYYQFTYRMGGGGTEYAPVRTFVTQRPPNKEFIFTMQADSHLDTSTDVTVYQQTLANMLADKPDFMVDLGDTTMVDKFGKFYTRASSQYLAQRFHMGRMAHSVPILFTLGNHDGEQGAYLTGEANSMPLWSVGMRKKYLPNPEPGGIYSGNTKPEPQAGLLQDYLAWEWGNALFVILDPFWPTRERKAEAWDVTLGEDQYRWLTATLEKSKAAFKFVFIHHLVGGTSHDARGGVAIAPYMEWGGKNADGSEGFAQHRPGWAMPIHQLFLKNKVSAVFHGHDHLFVKEELDGIVYQEVPQPGHPSGGTRSAEEYGYQGVILGSSGHLRVNVGATEARVDYVRSIVPGVTRDEIANGTVVHSYVLRPR